MKEEWKIGWVRHGETAWNREGRMQGQRDVPLNEEGKKQAAALAERLAGEDWDLIVSSDLNRAVETAKTVSMRTGVPLAGSDPRLRERAFGKIEGVRYEVRDRVLVNGYTPQVCKEWGIESDREVRERGLDFVREAEKKFAGKSVLVVSHGGLIRQVLSELLGRKMESLGNTSVSVVRKTGEGWVLERYNCTRHLEE